jgi:hypothetical protein
MYTLVHTRPPVILPVVSSLPRFYCRCQCCITAALAYSHLTAVAHLVGTATHLPTSHASGTHRQHRAVHALLLITAHGETK